MDNIQQDCHVLEEYSKIFQDLMLTILQRRALFRAFEESLIGKNISDENPFLKFYAGDYRRSQFADLRKFFDDNKRFPTYKFSFITKHCSDKTILDSHQKLLTEWKEKFKDIANKIDFHLEEGFVAAPVFKKQLDCFIDEVNEYIDKVIEVLVKDGHKISYLMGRKSDSDFLVNWQKEYFDEFKKIVCEQGAIPAVL